MGTDLRSQDSHLLCSGLEHSLKAGDSVSENSVECANVTAGSKDSSSSKGEHNDPSRDHDCTQEERDSAAADEHDILKGPSSYGSSGDQPSKSISTTGEVDVSSSVSENEGFPETSHGYSLESYLSDFKSSGSSDWNLLEMSYIDKLLGKLKSPEHPTQTEQKHEQEEDVWEDNRCPSTFCVSAREESWPMQFCVENKSSTFCTSDTANSQPAENVADITEKLDQMDQKQSQKESKKEPPVGEVNRDYANFFQDEHLNRGEKVLEKTNDCQHETKTSTDTGHDTMRKEVCALDKSHPGFSTQVELQERRNRSSLMPSATPDQTVLSPSSQIISEEHLQALQLLGLSDGAEEHGGNGNRLSPLSPEDLPSGIPPLASEDSPSSISLLSPKDLSSGIPPLAPEDSSSGISPQSYLTGSSSGIAPLSSEGSSSGYQNAKKAEGLLHGRHEQKPDITPVLSDGLDKTCQCTNMNSKPPVHDSDQDTDDDIFIIEKSQPSIPTDGESTMSVEFSQHKHHPISDLLDSRTSSRCELSKEKECRSHEEGSPEDSGNTMCIPDNTSGKDHHFEHPHFTEDFTVECSYTGFSLLDLPPRMNVEKTGTGKNTAASPGSNLEKCSSPEGNSCKLVLAQNGKAACETWLNRSEVAADSFQHLLKHQRGDSGGAFGGSATPHQPQNTGGISGQHLYSQDFEVDLFSVKPTLPSYGPAPYKSSRSSGDVHQHMEQSLVSKHSKQKLASCSGTPTGKSSLQTSSGQPEVSSFPAVDHSEVHTRTEKAIARKETFCSQGKRYQSDSMQTQPGLRPPPYRVQRTCQKGEEEAKPFVPQNSAQAASTPLQSSQPVQNVHQSLDLKGEAERAAMDADSKIVVVKGEALNQDKRELCMMYFENEKRSGGGEIEDENVVWNEEQGCFFITFGDSHVAQRVASREHKVGGCPVQVQLWTPEAAMDTDSRIVMVKGEALTQDQHELCVMYFENEKRSGGGGIEEKDVVWNEEQRCFFITFGDSHVAQRVASQEHKLGGRPIQAQLWTPGGRSGGQSTVAMHDDRVFITGLPPDTTAECLQNYLECTIEYDVESVQVNKADKSALVFFQPSSKKPDVEEVNHACRESPLDEGVCLSFHMVPVSSPGGPVLSTRDPAPSRAAPVSGTVLITGLHPETANENIRYYFSNKRRSAGGRVTAVDRAEGSSHALVHFENPADAESVILKGNHKLDEQTLTVTHSVSSSIGDMPRLQEAVSPQAVPSAAAPLASFRPSSEGAEARSQSHLEPGHMISNIQVPHQSFGKKEFRSQNSSMASNAHMQYNMEREQRDARSSDYGHQSGPYRSQNSGPAPSVLAAGSEASKNQIPLSAKTTEIELGEDVIQKISQTTHLLKTFIAGLRSCGCRYQWKHPDHVVIKCLEDHVWNWERRVDEFLDHFIPPIKEELQSERNRSRMLEMPTSTFESDKLKPGSSRRMEDAIYSLKSGQMKILRLPKALEQLKRDHPGLEISVDEVKKAAIVTAPETSMKRTFAGVLSFVTKITEIKIPLSPAVAQMLRKKDAEMWIEKTCIDKCGMLCHWEACDDHITVCAENSDAERLEQMIKSAFREDACKLSENEACLMKSPTGISFMERMQEKNRGECPAPVLLLEEKQVSIVDIPSNISETRSELKKFLNENQLENESIQINPNHAKCLEEYFKEEVDDLREQARGVGVSVTFTQTGVTAKGPKDSLAEVVRKVKDIAGRIKENKMTFKEPGVTRYLTGFQGQAFLSKAGKDTSCYITTGGASTSTDTADQQLLGKIILDSNHQVLIVQGDITQCQVDAIVNAANERLSHGGGVALAIAKAGGRTIQEESDAIVATEGKVREGEVAVTKAGSLSCSHILHAVGPMWSGGDKGEDELLDRTVRTTLKKAETMGLTSVAMPAISCGIFRYPVDKATNTIMKAIAQHFKNVGRSSCLNKLILIDKGSESLNGFLTAAKQHFSKQAEIVGTPKSSGSSGRRGGSHTPDKEKSPDHGAYGGKPHAPIKVISGDIARSKADVIVCATHPSLDLRKGVLSKSILERGGDEIQQELKDFSDRYGTAELGKVVHTTGGRLSCKAVYHLSLPRWRDDHGKKMRSAVERCLDTASKQRAQSIAFPTLGTGRLGYPGNQVASIMFSAIGDWFQNNSHSSLKEVQIIVFNRDTDTLEAFKTEEKQGGDSHRGHRHSGGSTHSGGRHSGGGHRENRHRDSGRGGGSLKTRVGRVTVMVKQGNILTEPCDAIVNSTNDNLDLSYGVLSKEISKACGPDFERECKSQRNRMKDSGVAITKVDSSDLSCGNVIHVSGDRFKRDWQEGILSVLQLADEEGLTSVSMPALGTGNRGADPVELAEAMQRAVSRFSDRARRVQEVRVVVFKQQLLTPYLTAFDPGAATGGDDDSDSSERGTSSDHSSKKTQSVDIFFYSKQSSAISEARDRIYKHVKHICSSQKETSPLIANFSTKQREELFKLQNKHGVEIILDQKKSEVTVKGVEIDVAKAMVSVKDIMLSATKQQQMDAGMPPVRWQYETGKDKFVDFEPDLVICIEAAYKKKDKEVRFSDKRGRKYKIVFKDNLEYPADGHGRPVKVKRRDMLQEKKEEIPLPTHWEAMKGSKVKRVELKPDSGEYKRVAAHFGTAVKKIERIQNPTLFQQFKVKKKEMEMYNPKGTENEKRLFHGTSRDSVDSIITNGFNRSYCGKNGTALGNGVYFAANSSVSRGYARDGQMFQARVLVGEHSQGSGGLRMSPNKPHDTTRPFDSVSDNPQNPSVFVIFHDSQAYPEYLITFQ